MQLSFETRSFGALSADELYDILALRAAVFVVEQDCAYQDIDGIDRRATHLIGRGPDGIVAYARWFEADGGVQLGRIVTAQNARGRGLGRRLMSAMLEAVEDEPSVFMEAQTYLISFYEGFGFEVVSEEFLEDGIPHVKMIRR